MKNEKWEVKSGKWRAESELGRAQKTVERLILAFMTSTFLPKAAKK
jgi:hypothetical protein